jgi:hypothetical protein
MSACLIYHCDLVCRGGSIGAELNEKFDMFAKNEEAHHFYMGLWQKKMIQVYL